MQCSSHLISLAYTGASFLSSPNYPTLTTLSVPLRLSSPPPTTARNQNCVEDPDNCVSEKLFKDIADRMVADGWRDAGYTYVRAYVRESVCVACVVRCDVRVWVWPAGSEIVTSVMV